MYLWYLLKSRDENMRLKGEPPTTQRSRAHERELVRGILVMALKSKWAKEAWEMSTPELLRYCYLCLFLFFFCSLKIVSYGQNQISLNEISDISITPPNTKAARPESLNLKNRLFVTYLQIAPQRTFRLLKLGNDLKIDGEQNLYSGKNQPTDIRICQGQGDLFVYAFETTSFQKGIPNHLSLGQYESKNSVFKIIGEPQKIAEAMPLIVPDSIPKPGDDLLDDASPFFHKNYIFVVNRKWESAIIQVQVFSPEIKFVEKHELNLGGFVPRFNIGKSCLVEINEQPYLVAMVYNGPPNGRNQSYIALIELDSKITMGKSISILNKTDDYEGFVSCARHNNGILYVAYDHLLPNSGHKGFIKAFDTKNGFREIGVVKINEGAMVDNHFSFEILENKMFVFYPVPGEEIRLKTISLKMIENKTNK